MILFFTHNKKYTNNQEKIVKIETLLYYNA